MTIPKSTVSGGHANDAEIVDNQSALNALLGVFTNGVLSVVAGGTGLASAFVNGILSVATGGTGIASYTIGDLLYASAATTLSKLTDIAQGGLLLSGGVGAAPKWLAAGTSGQLLQSTGSGSDVAWFSNPVVWVRTGTALSMVNSTYTTVKFDATVLDSATLYNASTGQATIQAGNGGIYLVHGSIAFVSSAPTIACGVFKNGVTNINEGELSGASGVSGGTTVQVTSITSYAAGDTIELKGWQNSGGALGLNGQVLHNFLLIRRLA